MLYTIRQFNEEPIVLVRVFSSMNINKNIYAIDADIATIPRKISGTVYRIDDLSNLGQQDFTLSDARHWFAGPIREDTIWRTQTVHFVIPSPAIRQLIARLILDGEQLHVSLAGSVPCVLKHIRTQILHHNR